MRTRRFVIISCAVLILAALGGGGRYFLKHRLQDTVYAHRTPEEKDLFVRFSMEAYDLIQENYWQKASDGDLSELYRLSIMKAASSTDEVLPTRDRSGVAKMLAAAFARQATDDARRQLALNTIIVVLYNLAPQGRSGLFSQEQEQAMRDTVGNIDRSQDLYAQLGLSKGASTEEVNRAYEEKKSELAAATSSEAREELARAERSHQVLSNDSSKAIYDQTQMQPTVSVETVGSHTVYIDMSKVSPASFLEFVQRMGDVTKNSAFDRMIIDLRGNIGGSLDFVRYFMGLFFGPNQYVFDLFHQGNYDAQRTPPEVLAVEELKRFKEIAVLADEMTQSTAELTAAVFQRFHLGYVVGKPTRGWGTVENTFPLTTPLDPKTSYSLFLTHSLTLRPDNQPIETRGVDPDVDVRNSGWKERLSSVFESSDLVKAIIVKESVGSKNE